MDTSYSLSWQNCKPPKSIPIFSAGLSASKVLSIFAQVNLGPWLGRPSLCSTPQPSGHYRHWDFVSCPPNHPSALKILSREAHGEPSHLPIFPSSESPMFDVNVNVGSGFLMENFRRKGPQWKTPTSCFPGARLAHVHWHVPSYEKIQWPELEVWKKRRKVFVGDCFWGSGWVITYCFSLDFTTLISGNFGGIHLMKILFGVF